MAETRRIKAAKGSVVVQPFRGRLRLCWTWQSKRLYLYLGLPDSIANRKVAEIKARQIELDIASNNFDPTLIKYKNDRQRAELSAVALFERFAEYKRKRVEGRTLEKYTALAKHLQAFFGIRNSGDVGTPQAEQFRDYLAQRLAPITLREWLGLCRAAWDWGIDQKLVKANPWGELVEAIKVPPKQRPQPFSATEIGLIVAGFRGDRHYAYYADFVEFLLGTGCRTGEAIGLRWGHLSEDCSVVWIGESVSRGRRKATKTNKDRQFRLSPRLQAMLRARKPEQVGKDDLVFPAPRGGPIDDHNFRNRAWVRVLAKQGVAYRKPYLTRSTFESHAIITHRLNPALVAEMTGHDPKTLFKHYLGSVDEGLQVPDVIPEVPQQWEL